MFTLISESSLSECYVDFADARGSGGGGGGEGAGRGSQ